MQTQTNKELQTRLDSLASTTLDKELMTMAVSFGKDTLPAFTFQIDMSRKNDTNQ